MATDDNKQAARELSAKLKLEKEFREQLKNTFAKINRRFRRSISETGGFIPDPTDKEEIRETLRRNYKRIYRKFGYNLRTGGLKAMDQINETVDKQMNDYIDNHSEEQAAIINLTNINRQQDSIKETQTMAATAGIILSNDELAQDSANAFENKYTSGIDTIAATETQNLSEKSKYTEASVVATATATPIYKTWMAVLDERTRMTHAAADGQTVQNTDAFTVGSASMLFPGDSSLGAPPEEIINCRCIVIFKR